MNIAIISPEYPPLTNWGGTATFNVSLAKVLCRLGHNVDVITYDGHGDKAWSTKVDGININYIRLMFTNKIANFLYFKFPFGLLRYFLIKKIPKTIFSFEWNIFVFFAFKKIDKKHKIDVIHTPPYSFPALLISQFYKKIHYIFHAQGAQREFNKFEPNRLDNRIISNIEDYYMNKVANTIIPCSDDTYKHIVHSFPMLKPKLKNIPNFSDIRLSKSYPNVSLDNIVFNGQLSYRKGIDILVNAFVDLACKNSHLKLFLVGRNGIGFKVDGQYCDFDYWFNNQKIPSDIKNRIFIFSQLDHQENLFEFLKTIGGVVVVPSRYEPFGYVTIEAMALNLPVIASNSGGSKQIITDEITGFLFEPNSKSLKKTLQKIFKMNQKKISKILSNASNNVNKLYSVNAVEKQYKNMYGSITIK
jgi:glycosyltransferase involved in cell wall biosynthesis